MPVTPKPFGPLQYDRTLLEMYVKKSRPSGRLVKLLYGRKLSEHDHARADFDLIIKMGHIIIGHPNASG